jgi:hypothetical protein
MNEKEAAVLRAAAQWVPAVSPHGTAKWVAIWTASLFVLALLGYGLAAMAPPAIVGGLVGGALLVAGLSCMGLVYMQISSHIRWRRHARDHAERAVPSIQAALRDATVNVTSVHATAVATIEQFEDEGDGFIFDVGDGQLLFLKGQEYRPDDDAMPWPNSDFEIIRSTVGDRWIGIFCSGAPLEPTSVLQSSECKHEIVWAHREDVVDATMDDFIRSIRAEPNDL